MEALKYIETQKRKKKIKKTIAVLMVLIGLLVLFLIKAPLFNINNINIVNGDEELVTKNEIETKLEVINGKNIFYVKRSDVVDILKDNPYIKDLKVTKALPNKLTVEIQEANKVFSIQKDGYYYVFDEEGKVLNKELELTEPDMVTVEGLEIQSKEIGEIISEDQKVLETIKDFGELFGANTSNIKFTKIDLSNLSNITVYYNEVSVKIGGNFDLTRKLNYAINILKNIDIKKGYIDVSIEGNPVIKEE